MVDNRNYTSPFSFRALLPLAMIAGMLPLTGCGDGIERVHMSGKVTYAGQPVDVGEIRFIPAPGTEMPLTVEKINNGQYETKIDGGVPVGTYQVAIRAYNPNDPVPKGPGDPYRRQLLPVKYNTQTELTITLEPGQTELERDFELPR